jgi:hypothetical protein
MLIAVCHHQTNSLEDYRSTPVGFFPSAICPRFLHAKRRCQEHDDCREGQLETYCIAGSAFSHLSDVSILIESENLHFIVKSDFIKDSSDKRLIRSFRKESTVIIPHHVQVVCSWWASSCSSLSSISFGFDSELTRIESRAFSKAPLKSITIPRPVQILCSECFSYCNPLLSLSFEADSELRHIEAGVFNSTSLSFVFVPENGAFIAGDAFPDYSAVTLAGSKSDAELSEWSRSRSSDVFERRA